MEIEKKHEGRSLLCFLYNELGLSHGEVKRLKQRDGIKINGRSVTVRHRLSEGEELTLVGEKETSKNIPLCDLAIDIIYEDGDILAVNKPSGLAVHPSAGNRQVTLAGAVMNYYKNTPFVFRAVSRLDKYTSGIVVVAKNAPCAYKLCREFEQNSVKKTYVGITERPIDPPKGEINAPIARQEGSVIKREVKKSGKPAVTAYETVETQREGTLLRLYPLTGRTHQIRVHLAYAGCPLKYDFLYGREEEGKHFLLHCQGLEFSHPTTGQRLVLTAPAPFLKAGKEDF